MSIYERDLTTGKLKVISGKPTIFTGATDSTDGTAGNVPAPIAGDEDKFLTGGGIWTPDTANLTTTYTTEDDDTTTAIITSAGGETAISTMESGAKHSRLFNKVSRVALNMRKLINTVKRIWNSVGATWVSGHAYAANDMVVYENGHVYKCILAHTSSSSILPTNTTYWVDTTLAAEIASLNSNYANKMGLRSSSFKSKSTSYTVTIDKGYLFVSSYNNKQSFRDVSLTLNGVEVAISSNSSGWTSFGCFPVKKNDVVNVSTTNGSGSPSYIYEFEA